MTGDLESGPTDEVGNGGTNDELAERSWTPAERALLDAALEFYGAAEGVIDYGGRKRPQLRQDAAGFVAVRQAMTQLERCVVAAHAEGATAQRIAEIARIEHEIVVLILQRQGAPASEPSPQEG